jgi:hypothetical protein
MDNYPTHPKSFPSFLRRHLSSGLDPRPVETIEGVSASKWTESHLYLLRVVITQTGFDENSKEVPPEAKEFLRTAEAHLKENTRLQTVLEAVKGRDHHLPTPRILRLLQRKEAREGLSFYVGIRGLLEPKSYYTPLLHDRDELVAVKAVRDPSEKGNSHPKLGDESSKMMPRKPGEEADDETYAYQLHQDGPNTRSQTEARAKRALEDNVQSLGKKSTKLQGAGAELAQNLNLVQTEIASSSQWQGEGNSTRSSNISDDDHAKKERVKDELVTTGMVDIFISLLFALYYEFTSEEELEVEGARTYRYRTFSVAQKYYRVETNLGDFNSKTDGGVYEILFDGEKCWRVCDTNVVDMEAKAAGTSEPLPQHVAELVAHIFARLKVFYKAGKFKAYSDLSKAQRTVYLFCFHQTNFSVLWATFTPEYLEYLFGSPKDMFGSWDSTMLHGLTSDAQLSSRGSAKGLRRSKPTQHEQGTSKQAARSKSTGQPQKTMKPIQQLYASQTLPIIFAPTRKKAAIIILALGLLNQNMAV